MKMKQEPVYREIDLARLAAFIDGEGTISIRVRVDRRNGRERTYPFIGIKNTDVRLLLWLKDVFGGCISTADYHKKPAHCRKAYEWRLEHSRVCDILQCCLPFFLIKKEQAEIAIAHETLVRSIRARNGRASGPEYQQTRPERIALVAALKDARARYVSDFGEKSQRMG